MSLTFQFETDTPEMAELLYGISEKVMRPEAAKAMNRTMTFIRKEAAKDVASRTGIKETLIRRRIKPIRTRRASSRKLATQGFIGETPVLVSLMSPKPRKAGRGVTYRTIPGQAPDPKAFYAVMTSGKKSAFVRKGAPKRRLPPKYSALPIEEERADIGPFLRRAVRGVLRSKAGNYFNSTFYENMDKRLMKEVVRRGLRE